LIVLGQDGPGHAALSDKQIFTQLTKIASLEHHLITMLTLVSQQITLTTC